MRRHVVGVMLAMMLAVGTAAGAEALGYPAIKGKLKGGEQGLVTVFAGPFGSKTEAEAAQKKLRKAGFPDAILMEY